MIPIRHGLLIFLQVSSGFYLFADLVAHGSVSGLVALVCFTASWFALDYIDEAQTANFNS
jgi:hypothetical protein